MGGDRVHGGDRRIAERLGSIVDTHGPESFAVSTSDWNTQTTHGFDRRFMNLLGSPNWISDVSLCAGPMGDDARIRIGTEGPIGHGSTLGWSSGSANASSRRAWIRSVECGSMSSTVAPIRPMSSHSSGSRPSVSAAICSRAKVFRTRTPMATCRDHGASPRRLRTYRNQPIDERGTIGDDS